ncbi:hypothetical protein POJ06DRAFT_25949 [Lipomyces tetrasporus]|uniref:DOD-type homing endonuclease domain-containing protein n=1 Tax=Lipomyces tetrasporus TaxID=54092 RepID=A0AAD7VRA7_9ASCO|nr:uncharacterized protein POJ06DRAFT_25949 [Lipomyces tetrasporus]KAJ8097960.1 hypothetical protein POJ06DRAFT_25949 [Lipomyces tetrasporus]
MPSQGLAPDTMVRTTTGVKPVGDIQIGDYLYDAANRPVPCIGVAQPVTGALKKITYTEFDSRAKSSFTFAPGFRLSLTASQTTPSLCTTTNAVCWFTRCERTRTLQGDGNLHLDADSSSVELDDTSAIRFAVIRKSIDSFVCGCKGFRTVMPHFTTESQAQLALSLLRGDRHHVLDPLIVRDGDKFNLTLEEYGRLCNNDVKRRRIWLYRAPLSIDLSTASTGPQDLPLDPYFLGLWLGDGHADNTRISSVDPEIIAWLQSYVHRLNRSAEEGAPMLHLAKSLSHTAGTKMRNGYVRNHDCFAYRIACSEGKGRRQGCNPVLEGLRKLGLLNNKSGGIPSSYMTADEDTRLAVIAGLIDSDGMYSKRNNHYRIVQSTEGHKKIVYDLKELARGCGICVTGVHIEMRRSSLVPERHPAYIICLGQGSQKFQKHLLLDRKKMNLQMRHINHDNCRFTISDASSGEYREFEVSGDHFQLANGLVVCN